MITQRCLLPNEMQQYLNGWSSEAESRFAELHLSECPDCERTIGELESASTFLAAEFRSVSSDAAIPNESESVPALENRLNATIEKIRNWNGHPPEDLLDTTQPTNHVLTGDFGNYELFEVVGTGGMAEVYRARHKRLQRDVALKLIRVPRRHMAESLNRIEREIRAVGRLRHPAIVNAVDAGEHEGVQFLVTEFIDGIDVGKMVRALGTIPIAEACEIVRVTALGLDHAHANGIVHRDIKPSNLMLDKSGAVKILDFGLVQLDGWAGLSAEVTSVGQLLGTLDYMAPEQADRADHATYRSDIWSLGATLFRLLCGRAPYAANSNQSPLEKLRLLAIERPPRIATLRPDLPPELAELIDRTLDRDPAGRPSSAAHFAEALVSFCGGADLAAMAQSALEKNRHSKELVDDHADHVSSVSGFLADSTQKRLAESNADSTTLKTSPSRFRRVIPWAVALLLFGFFSYAGIVIILETQQGQIVIESDAPDLQVHLVKDGKVRKQVELVPGENVTHLYAGEYEIRINDGTDSYAIENNSFLLKRREKVVAKITVNAEGKRASVAWNSNKGGNPNTSGVVTDPQVSVTSTNGAERDESNKKLKDLLDQIDATAKSLSTQVDVYGQTKSTPKTTNVPSEPVYQGKTLSEWLSVVKFEKDHEQIRIAMNAVSALCADDNEAILMTRKSVMDAISNRNIPGWTFGMVRWLGLTDENVLTIESMLKPETVGSIEDSRKLIQLLAIDARRGLRPERRVRVHEILLSPNSNPLLFAGDEGISWSKDVVTEIAFLPNSPPNFLFLESVIVVKHLGPRIITRFDTSDVSRYSELKRLMFVAAYRAIEQYGADHPEFSHWANRLDVYRKNAPVDLVNDLPKMIERVLLEIAKSDKTLGKLTITPMELGSDGNGNRIIVSSILKPKYTGRFSYFFDRSRGQWRLASPALDLLALLEESKKPLDENSRKAIEAIGHATEARKTQLISKLETARKEHDEKSEDNVESKNIQLIFSDDTLQAIVSTTPQEPSITVSSDIAIAAIIHEKATLMLKKEPATKDEGE
ncbi:MAG: serine/threonine-protein kinase [Pirellulaceae bacterium]